MSDRDERRKEIGQRLRDAARECGYTADEIGAAVGVAPQTIYGWWRGSRQPDLVDLELYAEATGRDPGWFYNPEGKRTEGATDLVVRILSLVMEGIDFGKAHDQVLGTDGMLSPRDRRMVSAGTAALRSYIMGQEEWSSLSPEERIRLLRHVVDQAHREG